MKFSLLAFAALAACSPLALFKENSDELVERATTKKCTEYCSPSAGCVCVNWPKNCTAFYTVQPNDTCVSVAEHFNNFTVTQLYKWNPDVGQTCFGIQAYVPVCINTPGYVFTPPVQPAYGTHDTPAQTPVPVMPNITTSCTSYELVKPGTTPAQLAKQNDFPVKDFALWNGNSTSAWAGYWACVKV